MSTPEMVEHHLNELEATGEGNASAAIAHAFAAIGAINQQIAPPRADQEQLHQTMLLGPDAGDELVQTLQKWIERLLNKLRELVKQLADVLTFSLSVGTTISLTVNFSGASSTSQGT